MYAQIPEPPDDVVVEEVVVDEVVVEDDDEVLFTDDPPLVPPPVDVVVIDPEPVPPSEVTEILPLPEIEALVPLTLIVAEFLPSKSMSPLIVGVTSEATVSAVKAELSKELLVNANANSAIAQIPKNDFFITNCNFK